MDRKPQGIQLDEDMQFQRREWLLQRVGWAFMTLILVAALLGFLGGPGLFNETHWGKNGDPIWVQGRRIERHHRPSELQIHFGPQVGNEGRVEFWIEGEFAKKMKFEGVLPQPVEMRRDGQRLVFVVKASPDTATKIQIEPDGFGQVASRVGIVGGSEVDVTQYVLP